MADKEATAANLKAAKIAAEKFETWVKDGPGGGLKRQHMFSRCATGWVQSKVSVQHEAELNDFDDLEGVSQQDLLKAIAPRPTASPLLEPSCWRILKKLTGASSGPPMECQTSWSGLTTL